MQKITTKQKITLIIFGLFLSVVLLEIGLRIGGLVYLTLQEHVNKLSLRQTGSYKILCLGESVTAMGGEDSYPRQLEEILNQRRIGVKFTVINKGIPGGDTGVIVSQLEYNLDNYKPVFVITMMGENEGLNTKAFEDISIRKNIFFFKALRIYKLINILSQIFFNKVNEIVVPKKKENKEDALSVVSNKGQLNNSKEEEAKLRKSREINPKNEGIKGELGWQYWNKGEYDKAEKILKGILALNPKCVVAYAELGRQYWSQGKYAEAEETLKRGININPINDKLYGGLAICYTEQGKNKSAEEYFEKAKILSTKYYNPITLHNYQKLKEMVIKRGLILVCIQSPLRSINSVKQMIGAHKSVFFVDNELVFKEAIKHGKYADYFKDMCAGDSGHCLPKGNRLLAQQIANVILRECFSELTK